MCWYATLPILTRRSEMLESGHFGGRWVRIDRSTGVVRFDGFELQVRSGELCQGGKPILRLPEQPLRILIALLERPGDLVLREDLRKRLWPSDTVVEFEHGIGSAVNRLRQALGDSAENPRFIETLARRGYRWKTPVEWVVPESAIIPEIQNLATHSMRADLDAVMPETRTRTFHWRTPAVAIAVFVLAAVVILGLLSLRTTRPTTRDFRQRQLTVNSFENPVSGGSISPDGKYLAYNDLDGIHLKLIETGEIQSIPAPEIFRGSSPYWEVGFWLPDSTHFFAVAERPQQPSSLWNVSVTGSMRRIAEDSNPWEFLPMVQCWRSHEGMIRKSG
jgi:DNA-binding winged helix-turn-helix (wHTH) protein